MAEPTPNTDDPKVSKATLTKNIIFAVFIVFALIFCLRQFNKGQKLRELNQAIELLSQAREASPIDYTLAKQALDIFESYTEEDFQGNDALIDEYNRNRSLCYSTLAESPALTGQESQKYYMTAFALDETNPDIPEAMAAQFRGISGEVSARRAALLNRVQQITQECSENLLEVANEMKGAAAATAEEAKEALTEAVEAVQEAAEPAAE